ncbi:MAG: FAD:protein FMN transferase [Actinobacteria bacterium]|nr:FAD:protein FMN transferase [Actinomycetota bacterium]
MAASEFRGRVMASELHIITLGATPAMVADAVAGLEHLERCWSRFIPTSDISRINATAGGVLAVDDSTITLLASMIEGHRVTEGRFDPTVLPSLIEQGYAASISDPSLVTVLPADDSPTASVAQLVLDPDGGTVAVPPGLALDPGGIGKGLAADLAVAMLRSRGASGALVSIGGDLAMSGSAVIDDGWLVKVEHADPLDGVLCTLALDGGGVATSSTRSRRWVLDDSERHHQIDPRTGRPSTTDLAAVTVIGRSGWLAEVHATAAIACGSTSVMRYLSDHGLSGVAIDDRGAVHLTPDLEGVTLNEQVGAR